jgi:hypothetical protein
MELGGEEKAISTLPGIESPSTIPQPSHCTELCRLLQTNKLVKEMLLKSHMGIKVYELADISRGSVCGVLQCTMRTEENHEPPVDL